jgi:hypothetical protein
LEFFSIISSPLTLSLFDPPRLPNRNYRCDFIARSPSRGELELVSFMNIVINVGLKALKGRAMAPKVTWYLFLLKGRAMAPKVTWYLFILTPLRIANKLA